VHDAQPSRESRGGHQRHEAVGVARHVCALAEATRPAFELPLEAAFALAQFGARALEHG